MSDHILTTGPEVGGTISPLGATTVPNGGSQLFTATPDPTHLVNVWSVDNVVVQSGGLTYDVTNVTADHFVDVDFFGFFRLTSDATIVDPKHIHSFECFDHITPQGNNTGTAPPVYFSSGGTFAPGTYRIAYIGGARQSNTEPPGCWVLEHDTNHAYQIFYDGAEQASPFPGATLTCFASSGLVESANAGLSYEFTTISTDKIGIRLAFTAIGSPGVLLPYFQLCGQIEGLLSDAYIVGSKFLTIISDAVVGLNLNQFTLGSDAIITQFIPPIPPSIRAAFFCKNKINECACEDDPVSNYSAEGPDLQLFCAVVTFTAPPNLGVCDNGSGFSATEECCSSVSYEDAYMCALRKAQEKVWGAWLSGTCQPPGCPPNCDPGCPPFCPPTCPPFCPPDCPPNCGIQLFYNSYQVCSVKCQDGSEFAWAVLAGTVVALTQLDADKQAHALACKLAQRNKICFITVDLPVGRSGIPYKDANGNPVAIRATGGTPFISPTDLANPNFPTECTITALPFGTRIPYHYQVAFGSLPPGLSFDCFGVITGTPTMNGNFPFTVKITDAIGAYQTKDYEIVVGCSPNPIKYQDSGYRFVQIPSDGVPAADWKDIAFDDSGWNIGQAAFGSGGACPLQTTVGSTWNINTDLLVRKSVTLPAGATNARLKAAVDNKIIEAYVNGTLVSGEFSHDFCPHYGDLNVAIPNGVLIAGKNVVAVRTRDSGLESFFDMEMTIDCP